MGLMLENRIRKIIHEQGRTSKWVSEQMGLSQSQFSQRLAGLIRIKKHEVDQLKKILNVKEI